MDFSSRLLQTPNVYAEHEPLGQPIYQTSVFQMPSYAEAVQCEHSNHPSAYYTRWGNPTITYLENQLLVMTGYEKSLIFPSGMSAITTTFLSLIQAGDHVFVSNRLYGDTLKFFIEELPRFGIHVSFFDIENIHSLTSSSSEENNIFIYFETLSNPDLVLADLEGIKAISKTLNAISICDATFTPPSNLAIHLPDYVDITIHSLTKYISGHFSSIGGAILCSAILAEKIWHTQSLYGACVDPHASWLISQGAMTLSVRLKEQNESALAVAEYLNQHPKIKSVQYPLLKSNPQFELATRLLNGGGGVVSFSLKGSKKAAIQLIESSRLIRLFISLGGIHSCIEHAQSMSHSMVTDRHRTTVNGVHTAEDLIRLSIGIESVKDIIADLDQALMQINIE